MKNLGRILTKNEQKKVNGGGSRQEYCDSLVVIINGGNDPDAVELALDAYDEHCSGDAII